MLTNVQPTSLAAFHQTASERELQSKRLLSFYKLKGAMSDRQASYLLGWSPAHVSARRNDLVKAGLVCEMGKKKDPDTNKLVMCWGEIKSTLF